MAKLRIALIGCGYWGRNYARIFREREDTALAAIVGRDAERGRKLAAEWDTVFYNDLETMLERERPDLVCISLPYREQAAMALRVIRAGFPLTVEKPLALDSGEAALLLREAESRGLFFAINFNHRYAKPFRLARQAIDAGRLGEPAFALWRFGGDRESRPPARHFDRIALPWLRHDGAFGRADGIGHVPDDRQDRRRLPQRIAVAVFRLRRLRIDAGLVRQQLRLPAIPLFRAERQQRPHSDSGYDERLYVHAGRQRA